MWFCYVIWRTLHLHFTCAFYCNSSNSITCNFTVIQLPLLDIMLSNKELSQKYFEKIGNGLFKCYECGKTRKQTENSGYSNLINHIKQQHPGWEKCNTQASLNFIKCSKKAQNIHGWLDWIVTDGHPFNFVDKDTTRNYSKLDAICTNTLTKYMDLTTKQVEIKIREEMPMKIGLMLDGWCEEEA